MDREGGTEGREGQGKGRDREGQGKWRRERQGKWRREGGTGKGEEGGTGRGKEDGVVDIIVVGGWWALIAVGDGVGCSSPLKVVLGRRCC